MNSIVSDTVIGVIIEIQEKGIFHKAGDNFSISKRAFPVPLVCPRQILWPCSQSVCRVQNWLKNVRALILGFSDRAEVWSARACVLASQQFHDNNSLSLSLSLSLSVCVCVRLITRQQTPGQCQPAQCRIHALDTSDPRPVAISLSCCLSVGRVLLFRASDVPARLWSLSASCRSIYYHRRPSSFSRPMRRRVAPARGVSIIVTWVPPAEPPERAALYEHFSS